MAKKPATKLKEIRIACEAATTLPLAEFQEFQGELKWLEPEEYRKLKESMVEDGFHDPIHVWKKKGERKPRKMLDGHQRVRALRKMIEAEGFKLKGGRLPVVWVIADDEEQASRIVLEKMSQYGRYSEDTLYRFMQERGLSWMEGVKPFVDWPAIHMGKFEVGWINQEPLVPPGDFPERNEDIETKYQCPKCGYKFS